MAKKKLSGKPAKRKRSTPAERAKILAEAQRLGLTGKEVAQKYGISMFTYYQWRKKAAGQRRRSDTGGASGGVQRGLAAPLRAAVRAKLRKLLPTIVRQELDAIVKTIA